ncbi:hypothetical protein PG985_013572 [Apiospora marii]|uniref:Uncharacterized protein n=1 Tax=Apiospora marii TaxID=335849 RepID=A0ABR1R7D6_9PEZI
MSPEAETPGAVGSNGSSPASELCAEAIRLFISIVKHISQSDGPYISETYLSCLQRSLDRFRLWDDAYGVSRGEIDYLFKGSRRVRRSITGLLVSISLNLIDRLGPLFMDELNNNPTPGDQQHQCHDMKRLIECITGGVDASSSTEGSADFAPDSIDEIAEDLKADTMGLLELDPLIRHPVIETETR